MEKIIELQEGLRINTTVTPLLFDRISVLYKKYDREEIGDFEYTLSVLKAMKTPESNEAIVDDIMNGELTEDVMDKFNKWSKIVQEVVL